MTQPPTHPDLGADYQIVLIQELHADLKLSREQAALLVEKTQLMDRISASYLPADRLGPMADGYLCSIEALDYHRSVFAQILTPEQFLVFATVFDANYQQHFDWITANDLNALPQIAFRQRQIAYVKTLLLPALQALRPFAAFDATALSEKRSRLHAAYSSVCDQLLLRNLRDHFRECRFHAPNGMRLLELESEHLRLLPWFPIARYHLDAADLSLADALLREFATVIQGENADAILAVFSAYNDFAKASLAELSAGSPSASTYVIDEPEDPAASADVQLMAVLLAGDIT